MSLDEILSEVEESSTGLRLTPKIFSQIEPLWPKGKNGKPVVSDAVRFSIVRNDLLEKIDPIGYVNVAPGIGSIYSSCPGYWIVLSMDGQYWRLKMGMSREEFERNRKRIPGWDGIRQLFL